MKFDPDDPKWTAYALGELDEAERQAVEAQLKESEEARRAVEEIRQTAAVVTEELQKETCPELSSQQRSVIAETIEPPSEKIIVFPWRKLAWAGLSGAAALVMVGVFLSTHFHAHRPAELDINSPRSRRGPEPLINRAQAASEPRQYSELTESYQTAYKTWVKPDKTKEGTTFDGTNASYAYGGHGLTEDNNEKKTKSDGGNALAQWQNPYGKGHGLRAVEPKPQTPQPLQLGQVTANEYYSEYGRVPPAPQSSEPGPAVGQGVNMGGRSSSGRTGNQLPIRREISVPTGNQLASEKAAEKSRGLRDITSVLNEEELDKLRRETDDFAGYIVGQPATPGTETYERLYENPFLPVAEQPLSTFSLDVDTASYANVRRFLNNGQRPPRDAVRIEELINYFPYRYDPPTGNDPFAVYLEVGPCPWNPEHRLARIGIKGKEIADHKRPQCNLVFLVDVSGSMEPANKLPLVKRALRLLVEQLRDDDRVAIVTYAGEASVALPSTSIDDKRRILATIDQLAAGGSTNGGDGIQRAYEIAQANFRRGVNRVILCTDGDFNVGITDQNDLVRLIEQKAKSGVFLSVLGFGMGNLKDSTMEKLADKGNGNYAYIDDLDEARKVLEDQLTGTLVTIAKDVKVQIEFNPAHVRAYRLIGYENRILRAQDFHNDRKDAGEVGAGHTVTALYEIEPAPRRSARLAPDALKYQRSLPPTPPYADELLTLKLRYKHPNADTSKLMEFPARDRDVRISEASEDFRFTAAVAAFGMVLRDSQYRGNATLEQALELAAESRCHDPNGHRAEFVGLVRRARELP